MSKSLLSAEHLQFAGSRYLEANASPAEIVVELKEKFGVAIRPDQLRQTLSRRGYCKRRRQIDAAICKDVSGAAALAIAKGRAAAPAKAMERWGEKLSELTDKALDMGLKTSRPRDLSTAVNTASVSIKSFRLVNGIDASPGGRPAFDYDFCNRPVVNGRVGPAVVEINVTPVSAS